MLNTARPLRQAFHSWINVLGIGGAERLTLCIIEELVVIANLPKVTKSKYRCDHSGDIR